MCDRWISIREDTDDVGISIGTGLAIFLDILDMKDVTADIFQNCWTLNINFTEWMLFGSSWMISSSIQMCSNMSYQVTKV